MAEQMIERKIDKPVKQIYIYNIFGFIIIKVFHAVFKAPKN